jgi:hypothetical protein
MHGNWIAATNPQGQVLAWLPTDIDAPPIIVATFENGRDARIAADTMNSLEAQVVQR